MRANDYDRYRREARAYNRRLIGNPPGGPLAGLEREEYERLLNPGGSGVMGQISIPKLHCCLPIYHGMQSEVCPDGMEHMPGSSLPVGGPGTHTVLSVNRSVFPIGITGKTACLSVGDVFRICVLGETLIYRIERVSTDDSAAPMEFRIDPAKDCCTLFSLHCRGDFGHWIRMHGVRRELFPLTEEKRIRWLYQPVFTSLEERRFPGGLRTWATDVGRNGEIWNRHVDGSGLAL